MFSRFVLAVFCAKKKERRVKSNNKIKKRLWVRFSLPSSATIGQREAHPKLVA